DSSMIRFVVSSRLSTTWTRREAPSARPGTTAEGRCPIAKIPAPSDRSTIKKQAAPCNGGRERAGWGCNFWGAGNGTFWKSLTGYLASNRHHGQQLATGW